MLIYFQDDLKNIKETYKKFKLETFHKTDLIKELYIMPKKEIVKVGMEESCGSDSNPSDDNLEEVFLNTIISPAKRPKCTFPPFVNLISLEKEVKKKRRKITTSKIFNPIDSTGLFQARHYESKIKKRKLRS